MIHKSLICLAVSVVALGAHTSFRPASAQDAGGSQPPQERAQEGPPGGLDGSYLTKGLKDHEGCLGVETAFSAGGKSLIFAWFEDKQSTVDWYWSNVHQDMMLEFTTGSEDHEPLEFVDDEAGPILCIASITPAKKKEVEGVDLPISQIAIELYTPLPGGTAFGGRFAPKKVKVPHMTVVSFGEEGEGEGEDD